MPNLGDRLLYGFYLASIILWAIVWVYGAYQVFTARDPSVSGKIALLLVAVYIILNISVVLNTSQIKKDLEAVTEEDILNIGKEN